MTTAEDAFRQCALMILHDQCPPDRRHYMCMQEEDESIGFCCTQCWSDFLWELTNGTIELPKKQRR